MEAGQAGLGCTASTELGGSSLELPSVLGCVARTRVIGDGFEESGAMGACGTFPWETFAGTCLIGAFLACPAFHMVLFCDLRACFHQLRFEDLLGRRIP